VLKNNFLILVYLQLDRNHVFPVEKKSGSSLVNEKKNIHKMFNFFKILAEILFLKNHEILNSL